MGCLGIFETNNKELVKNVNDCTEEERLYQIAFDEYRRVNLTIPALKRLIDYDIPAQISALDKTIKELGDEVRVRNNNEWDFLSRHLEPKCEQALKNPLNYYGYPSWFPPTQKPRPLRELVNKMTTTYVVGD